MKKLFEENAYLKKFETEIIGIKKEENLIELMETAFYGKAGGQPGDTGVLKIDNANKLKVIETIKFEKTILHKVDNLNEAEVGLKILGEINWQERYKYMRMHTALHLLCSIIPFGVTGGQIGYEKSRLDFNMQNNKIEKDEIENKINNLVNNDYEINYQWIDKKELDKNPQLIKTMSVKPPNTDGKIRLIKIGDVDLQPCGGTHVKKTSEIGNIKIGKIENKGKMNRRVNLILTDEESD